MPLVNSIHRYANLSLGLGIGPRPAHAAHKELVLAAKVMAAPAVALFAEPDRIDEAKTHLQAHRERNPFRNPLD